MAFLAALRLAGALRLVAFFLVALRFAGAFFAALRFAGAFFLAAFFLVALRFAGALFAALRFAGAFFAALRFAGAFLAAAFRVLALPEALHHLSRCVGEADSDREVASSAETHAHGDRRSARRSSTAICVHVLFVIPLCSRTLCDVIDAPIARTKVAHFSAHVRT